MAESAEEIAQHEKELDQFKMNWFKLDGKVAIVTGGNTGLGHGGETRPPCRIHAS